MDNLPGERARGGGGGGGRRLPVAARGRPPRGAGLVAHEEGDRAAGALDVQVQHHRRVRVVCKGLYKGNHFKAYRSIKYAYKFPRLLVVLEDLKSYTRSVRFSNTKYTVYHPLVVDVSCVLFWIMPPDWVQNRPHETSTTSG